MAELVYDETGRLLFTKEMKEEKLWIQGRIAQHIQPQYCTGRAKIRT